jgi:hypothetical protein
MTRIGVKITLAKCLELPEIEELYVYRSLIYREIAHKCLISYFFARSMYHKTESNEYFVRMVSN